MNYFLVWFGETKKGFLAVGGLTSLMQKYPYAIARTTLFSNSTCGVAPRDSMNMLRNVNSDYPWTGMSILCYKTKQKNKKPKADKSRNCIMYRLETYGPNSNQAEFSTFIYLECSDHRLMKNFKSRTVNGLGNKTYPSSSISVKLSTLPWSKFILPF